MLNWHLIRHCGLRYSFGYAGITTGIVILVSVISHLQYLLFAPIIGGVLLLLFVFGGTGTVRSETIIANANSPLTGTTVNPAENNQTVKAMPVDIKLFFYAFGLITFGAASLIAVSELIQ